MSIESVSSIPPAGSPLPALRTAAMTCHACPLWRNATQTVFGEGPLHAPLFLIGEQPGDEEDRDGHPFVGPSGCLLSRALEQAGIARAQTFVTNAVKHFKWSAAPARGKRRIHEKPNAAEVRACNPWLLPRSSARATRRRGGARCSGSLPTCAPPRRSPGCSPLPSPEWPRSPSPDWPRSPSPEWPRLPSPEWPPIPSPRPRGEG